MTPSMIMYLTMKVMNHRLLKQWKAYHLTILRPT